MAFLVHTRGGALAGDSDHRRAIHIGVRYACHQVGRARAEGRETHARIAGEPSIHIRHEGRTLLVAGEHELNVAVEQRIHDVEILFTG